MKKYKGAVFFDYDGTLIDEVDGIFELPDSAKEALTRLRANGYATCVCSGRTKQFSEGVKDYFDGYVTGNGGYVELDGERIFSNVISNEEIEELRAICNPRNIWILMDGENQSYSDGFGSKSLEFFRYVFAVKDHWIQPWDTEGKCPINKLTFLYEKDEDYDFLIKQFSDRLEMAKHIIYHFTDATKKGNDKGSGILKMLDYMGLSVEDSYCFCDGDNDLPQVKTVGHAVIMGRHYKGLEPYAEYVTDLVGNDGIKKGLEWLDLI